MKFTLIRASTLALGLIASAAGFAQNAERQVSVQPPVLDAKTSSACAPRDAATGQASGRRSSDYLLQLDDKKHKAVSQACDGAAASSSPQDLRESPTLQGSKHTKTGHVTLMK